MFKFNIFKNYVLIIVNLVKYLLKLIFLYNWTNISFIYLFISLDKYLKKKKLEGKQILYIL